MASERPPPLYGAGENSRVLVDSGPLLALFNKNDKWYGRICEWLETNPTISLVTTWPVLTEVCAMLARRVHNEAALDVLRWSLRGGLMVDGAPQESLITVLAISERFVDLPFDLADASIGFAKCFRSMQTLMFIEIKKGAHWLTFCVIKLKTRLMAGHLELPYILCTTKFLI
jgi:uncharacterized protein